MSIQKNENKPVQIKKERKIEQEKLDFQKLTQMVNSFENQANELHKRGDKSGSQKASVQANEIRGHLEKHRLIGLIGLIGLTQDEPGFTAPVEQMIQTARINFGIELNDPQVSIFFFISFSLCIP
tara:strand:+ start:5602 stop:5976 length:375 start_codon:yes stop_codon:yes gene_type:complete